MIFRLSQKLCTKLKMGSLPALPPDDDPLIDWSAHVFIADRAQYLLVTNTRTLYSIVMLGKGVTDERTFVERTLGNLREFLADDGMPSVFRRFIEPVGGTVRFASSLDRSVTGSMNGLIKEAKYCLVERRLPPEEVGFELNKYLRGLLQYAKPREVFQALLPADVPGDEGDSPSDETTPTPLLKTASGTKVYQFNVTLMESHPPIWRRIQVKDCTLDKLHEHIQTAMGWTNSHLNMFEINGTIYGDPALLADDFGDPFKDSTRVKLSRLIPAGRKTFRCEYEYDFGDGWRHEIVLEGISPPQTRLRYPICLAGARACPPEDCGGIPGYEELIATLADRQHEGHAEAAQWAGRFEPEKFDADEATRRMKQGLPDWRADDLWL